MYGNLKLVRFTVHQKQRLCTMTTNQPLSFFISGKMTELSKERLAVQAALAGYSRHGWLHENGIDAHPEALRRAHLEEIAKCDVYIGLFWLCYEPVMIEELEFALKYQKPCLLYEKHVNVDQRSPELTAFLKRFQQTDYAGGFTLCRFETAEQITEFVQKDVMRLLVTRFRESRQQPPPRPTSNSTTASAKNKGMAIGTTYSNLNRYYYAPSDTEPLIKPPLPMEHFHE